MLARLPGFTFDPGEAVRGFGGAAGNVLVDGQRPSAKSDTLESQLRRIPASSVDKIEIIRGGAGQVDM
ncbi:MAG: TonB-dependent receptor plug domain-containing protein [Sandarakinorhabdus sp.]|nr:TonB-dependent receptor plug domain-containing protein [Sandarakinorhabdus sp.]